MQKPALCYNYRMGTLFLVATPIGNLEDITLRALRVLGEADLIAAEDTRQTRKLLTRHQVETPLVSYHEHNKRTRQTRLLEALAEGDVALVSDAGTPGLSDPGFELVQAALQGGHTVIPIPGPSAPIAALVASGLPTDSFVFLGYLPRKPSDRRRTLRAQAADPRTLVAFEAPHRLKRTLEDLRDILGAERRVAICRELTKLHEEILRGSLQEMIVHFEAHEPRGEFTMVIGGAEGTAQWEEIEVREAMQRYLEGGLSRSQAAGRVALESGWKRREVYHLSLEE